MPMPPRDAETSPAGDAEGSRELDPLAATLAGDSGDTRGSTQGSASGGRGSSDRDGELPDHLGRYRLVRKLGEGGMGVVHLAHDDQLDRPVALKILRPGGNGDSRRLLREARSMARLSHPHIAAVYDVGTEGQDVYVAMEFVEGPTLRSWLDGSPPWPQRFDVLVQAARGLTAAHAAGVTHRDFKPDNVIVGTDGRARVLDFGLAKLAPRTAGRTDESTDTQWGAIVGTPRYMAPEQLRTQPAGPEADQFAFCVTAYEVAYGRRPFAGEVFADVAVSVLTQPPAEPPADAEVPEALWPVLRQGLQVDPAQRYQSMQALTEALEQVAGAPPEADPEPVVSRPALRDAREEVRQQLTQAYADDLLDADEIDERLERLENAEDPEAVRALVADLAPASEPSPQGAAAAPAAL
ncbi:MAG: protein kinase, partial [Myxococcales bacterium]|nr:protein kinase [Myxococcales bacterium]